MTTTSQYEDIKPQRPWQASTKDKAFTLGIFILSVVLAYGVVLVSGISVKLGMVAYFVFIFFLITKITSIAPIIQLFIPTCCHAYASYFIGLHGLFKLA